MTEAMKIDHEGYLVSGELRIQDETLGRALLENMRQDPSGIVTSSTPEGLSLKLLPFDQPLVVQMLEKAGPNLLLHGAHQSRFEAEPETLSLDEWDRFHGQTKEGLPFVLTRKAQNELFNLASDYGDDWIMWEGKKVFTPPFYRESGAPLEAEFWQEKYRSGADGWELGKPAPALVQALKSLKLSRQRIAVLGSGSGEDAAYLAQQGHLVTAFDFSPEALLRAKQKHGTPKGLQWVQADMFSLPASYTGKFDMVFDNACLIAIPPSKRKDLVKVWKKLLTSQGHLLGVLALFPFRSGPPFGLTEWEVHQLLGDDFQHLFWSRDIDSPPGRSELLVYSQLKSKEGP